MAFESRNPATGEVIKVWGEQSDVEVHRLLARAAETYRSYRTSGYDQRAEWTRNLADLLDERKEEYAKLMTSEMGKTLQSARAEVEKCALVCRHYASMSREYLAPEELESDGSSSGVRYEPIGPVLAVMPWNFPFWQVFRFAAPALMAGNVGLLKHASNVPGSAMAIEEVIRDAGFPAGCFTTLMISSSRVADVISHDSVAGVTLTGSEAAGRAVAASAGKAIKPVVLELGGSDPFVVMSSADLEDALSTALVARMMNNGQSCIAAKRFIVHHDIYNTFREGMRARIDALVLGDPAEESTDVGPLAREEFVDELVDLIERSVEAGAVVVAGGLRPDRPGYYLQPTLLDNVQPGMPAFDEETFGPVATLTEARDLDHAIALANQTRFGLGASVWTSDPEEQEEFVQRLEAGSVFVNGMVKSDPRLPFGGIKVSGVGRELSRFGIREFCNIKTVWRK